ncbi:MAG: hypothetical protein JO189_11600 [Deltaproteobacteria bacterium]|nr:hypothetical protein [Deltaproteobacteria bacterium]
MKNHGFETRASSLYEAVRIFGEDEWIEGIGAQSDADLYYGEASETEHMISVRDFECWLEANPRSPAEMVLKNRLRELLG